MIFASSFCRVAAEERTFALKSNYFSAACMCALATFKKLLYSNKLFVHFIYVIHPTIIFQIAYKFDVRMREGETIHFESEN